MEMCVFAILQKGGPGGPLLWRRRGREHGLGRSGGCGFRRLKERAWRLAIRRIRVNDYLSLMKPSSPWLLSAWKACWLLHGDGCGSGLSGNGDAKLPQHAESTSG